MVPVAYPQIRLAFHGADGKETPLIHITGEPLTQEMLKNQKTIITATKPLLGMLAAAIEIRLLNQTLHIPDDDPANPFVNVAQRLLALVESGKAGAKASVIQREPPDENHEQYSVIIDIIKPKKRNG